MLVGKILKNRYKILQVIGSGGFGDTYLAQDIDLPGHPACVVKQLKPKDTSSNILPIAKGLFEREAEYLYKLGNAHSQIPKLYAHFEENREFFLVQEFIDGHSLAEEILVGQKLSESATINLLEEILEVLAFVHQHNVIHRDIKLANLMRRRQDGKIVLIDFGAVKDISVLGTDPQGNTNVTVSIGSPGYMPSEQARGKPRLSSDVYAVGMIGIQALTGITPDSLQEDANTGEILWRNYAEVSDTFAEVLQNMVFYHFSQRYKSAIEALQAVQSLSPTKINNTASERFVNIAPTEAIANPLFESSHETNSSPTIITNSANSNGAKVPVFAPTTPQTPPTTPQVPATTAHVTISAPPPSSRSMQPIILAASVGLILVSSAIAAALILPKLNNRQAENSPKPEVSITPTISPTSSPSASASPETPEPTPTETTPIPDPKPNPSSVSFGAIARSPTTQSKGYSWNYPTQKAAEARALNECEKSSSSGDCKILMWTKNACMSLAEGSNGAAGSGWSVNLTEAENTAKQVCQQYQGINCEVARTICLPVRE